MLPLPIVAPQPVKWIRRRSSVSTMLILDFRIAGLHKPYISRPHVCFLLSHFSKGYCPQCSSDKDILEWIPFNGKWKFLADYEASCWIWIHSSKVKLNISICNPPKRIQIIMHKGSPKITSSSNLTSIPLWRFDFFFLGKFRLCIVIVIIHFIIRMTSDLKNQHDKFLSLGVFLDRDQRAHGVIEDCLNNDWYKKRSHEKI